MRTGWMMVAVIGTLLMTGETGHGQDAECWIPRRVLDPLDQCPTWTGRTDALLLWRDAPQGVGLFDSIGLDPGPDLNASSLTSGMAAGPRFTLFRHTGDGGALEFNYFRVQDFSATESRVSGPTNGFVFADGVLCCDPGGLFTEVGASLTSELQSFELNRRLPTDGRLQWLAGFRWFQWNDLFATGGIGPSVGDYGIRTATNNDLYGMQVGLDSILWRPGGRFWVEGLGKTGLYYNRSGQFTTVAQNGNELASGGTSTSRAAFVGELGVTGVWQVTDWLAIRTGWVAFWLEGLALGPNQITEQCLICRDLEPRQATVTGGGVFVQGLSLGLEARW